MIRTHRLLLALALLLPTAGAQSDGSGEAAETPWGHSTHGAAYDDGPRQKPWVMEGIGSTPFPITSSHPDVQAWFDQAVTLMHGFWWYEAERSLRWCLKLDPECAMAYWGLSVATAQEKERSTAFLDEAVARKDGVTARERAYIEVAEVFRELDRAEDAGARGEAKRTAMESLDRLLMDHPDDVEAKALYWLMAAQAIGFRDVGLTRYALESVLDDILDVDPDHVGALHYRVHNWDGKDGRYAVESCMKLGQLAPGCGHLLHMPGHVLSGIGLWHEAAIAMDRATRVEKAYMNARMILPEDNWDYVHNLDYLCYIQEQLGMVDQALLGARQLLEAPGFTEWSPYARSLQNPTVRALVKFERWQELLDLERVRWNLEIPSEKLAAGYARVRALIGLGDPERIAEAEAGLADLRETFESVWGGEQPEPADPDEAYFVGRMKGQVESRMQALDGLLRVARGEHLEGLSVLLDAARVQAETWENDPPTEGEFLYNVLGDQYLKLGSPKLAVDCFEKTLETVFHDGFALAGLVVAHAELGDTAAAEEAMGKLGVVWSDATRPNRWLAAAEATGITAEPALEAPVEQRNYRAEVLDELGPSLWIRSDVPELTARDAFGEEVSLEHYRGENVVLIFYLGEECVHCIEQLQVAEERLDGLFERDTVVLAVSADSVEEIERQQGDFGVLLLSDETFESARRFHAYDDFEEIELHATFLLDRDGRLHWSRIGGEPFTDFDFLEREIDRLNAAGKADVASAESSGDPGSSAPSGAGGR